MEGAIGKESYERLIILPIAPFISGNDRMHLIIENLSPYMYEDKGTNEYTYITMQGIK